VLCGIWCSVARDLTDFEQWWSRQLCSKFKAKNIRLTHFCIDGDLLNPIFWEIYIPKEYDDMESQQPVPRCDGLKNMDFSTTDCYHHFTPNTDDKKKQFQQKLMAIPDAEGMRNVYDFILVNDGEVRFIPYDEKRERGHSSMLSAEDIKICESESPEQGVCPVIFAGAFQWNTLGTEREFEADNSSGHFTPSPLLGPIFIEYLGFGHFEPHKMTTILWDFKLPLGPKDGALFWVLIILLFCFAVGAISKRKKMQYSSVKCVDSETEHDVEAKPLNNV